jgi:hypothetical protein
VLPRTQLRNVERPHATVLRRAIDLSSSTFRLQGALSQAGDPKRVGSARAVVFD